MPRIAYFGPSGTFTEMALAQFEKLGTFGAVGLDGAVERVSASNPPAALEAVRSGAADAAVVPIESSIEGAVPPTLDALSEGRRLQIVAETEIEVAFTILGGPGVTLDSARTISAYPIALNQVRQWLQTAMPDAVVQSASSNAGAAEDVVAGMVDAAVSTRLAGERLKLSMLADGVIDVEGARTRFVLVTAPQSVPARTGADRTSVVLEPPNDPGTLPAALAEFGIRNIDLTFIESRPTRSRFGTYRFFIDCAGHIDDPLVAEMLAAFHRKMPLRFLGSWPTATGTGGSVPPPIDEHVQWVADIRAGRGDL
ncbi:MULTISPECIES: prephenate dehydratase [unclassified Rhodococcus (in: high G+C Gram-positive bacteria)]|uniref:prephenate dehydratase n=1 Tax=unclassified Rhodococcus (in: high G+C Gram-positive bacteria) TaxID=192944 RepID=UPI000B9ADD37|nr:MULTISPECIES: prephenate dehydratase [unclassified Rhodococcus (in: high G+C Gram-positive bacteria)]OZE42267.1 prephenate dehydratase [Rhodococcus sp. 05-2254-4]OZE49802.1 prephenate dehydratase [Rhodococcus sp. 05-2254-3]OZE50441.1 prephenate dehydratase [Rhodococcus sp. 05-2254-2]